MKSWVTMMKDLFAATVYMAVAILVFGILVAWALTVFRFVDNWV